MVPISVPGDLNASLKPVSPGISLASGGSKKTREKNGGRSSIVAPVPFLPQIFKSGRGAVERRASSQPYPAFTVICF